MECPDYTCAKRGRTGDRDHTFFKGRQERKVLLLKVIYAWLQIQQVMVVYVINAHITPVRQRGWRHAESHFDFRSCALEGGWGYSYNNVSSETETMDAHAASVATYM